MISNHMFICGIAFAQQAPPAAPEYEYDESPSVYHRRSKAQHPSPVPSRDICSRKVSNKEKYPWNLQEEATLSHETSIQSKPAEAASIKDGSFFTKTTGTLESSFSSVDDNFLDEELMAERLPSGHCCPGRHRRSHNMDFTTVLPELSLSALELSQHPLKR